MTTPSSDPRNIAPKSKPANVDAGNPPTPAEAEAADRAKKDVDLDKAAKHESEMNKLGANTRGEGQIDPSN